MGGVEATLPIDVDRWRRAVAELRERMRRIDASATAQEWDWIRAHYAVALATHSLMSAEQQAQVVGELDVLRGQLEQRAH